MLYLYGKCNLPVWYDFTQTYTPDQRLGINLMEGYQGYSQLRSLVHFNFFIERVWSFWPALWFVFEVGIANLGILLLV
jgi:hypothetical protein